MSATEGWPVTLDCTACGVSLMVAGKVVRACRCVAPWTFRCEPACDAALALHVAALLRDEARAIEARVSHRGPDPGHIGTVPKP